MAKFFSTFLSLLLLLSSSGLTYAQHFCGGHEVIAELTVGEKDLNCGMAMEEGGCCDNEYTNVDTDDSHAAVSIVFDIDNPQEFFGTLQFEFFHSENSPDSNNEFYIDYSPPPLGVELYILYETFLI